MLLTLYVMLNAGAIGDNNQIQAIQYQIVEKYKANHSDAPLIKEYQDDNEASIQALQNDLTKDGKHIILISGSHGFNFVERKDVQELIRTKKPEVIWTGHQEPPSLIKQEALFNLVALPQHIIEQKPALKACFGHRLLIMQAVPNTLKAADLSMEAIKNWNNTYHHEVIPHPSEGIIGVFLGGDAPEPDNTHLFWSEKNAYELGRSLGNTAAKENKYLLATNGPRTGKFYPESPDKQKPVIRQFRGDTWITWNELTNEQKKQPNMEFIAHAPASPIDPVSVAFIKGVRESLEQEKFLFIDFKTDFTSNKPDKFTKSAYKAIISALVHSNEASNTNHSVACYSGESISYAEIAYHVPQTFAFEMDSMNTGHQNALKRFENLQMIRKLDFTKSLEAQFIAKTEKEKAIILGAGQDAMMIATEGEKLWLANQAALILSSSSNISHSMPSYQQHAKKNDTRAGDEQNLTPNKTTFKLNNK